MLPFITLQNYLAITSFNQHNDWGSLSKPHAPTSLNILQRTSKQIDVVFQCIYRRFVMAAVKGTNKEDINVIIQLRFWNRNVWGPALVHDRPVNKLGPFADPHRTKAVQILDFHSKNDVYVSCNERRQHLIDRCCCSEKCSKRSSSLCVIYLIIGSNPESTMHCLVNDSSHGRLFCMSIVANVCGTSNLI